MSIESVWWKYCITVDCCVFLPSATFCHPGSLKLAMRGVICTPEISKYYSSLLPFSLSPRAVVQHLTALYCTQSLPIQPTGWSGHPFLTSLQSVPWLCRRSASQVLQVGVTGSVEYNA